MAGNDFTFAMIRAILLGFKLMISFLKLYQLVMRTYASEMGVDMNYGIHRGNIGRLSTKLEGNARFLARKAHS
jgi:hypothetical protein